MTTARPGYHHSEHRTVPSATCMWLAGGVDPAAAPTGHRGSNGGSSDGYVSAADEGSAHGAARDAHGSGAGGNGGEGQYTSEKTVEPRPPVRPQQQASDTCCYPAAISSDALCTRGLLPSCTAIAHPVRARDLNNNRLWPRGCRSFPSCLPLRTEPREGLVSGLFWPFCLFPGLLRSLRTYCRDAPARRPASWPVRARPPQCVPGKQPHPCPDP